MALTQAEIFLKGLSQKEASRRLARYGKNEIEERKRASALLDFFLRLKSPFVFILIFAAFIEALFGDWLGAAIITAIIVASVVLDFINTYKSQKAAKELMRRVKITATVVRDRTPHELPFFEIVPGDIIMLSPGDLIPADGTVIHAKDLFVNESTLTGESFPVEKIADGQVFMGSSMVAGNGVMEVTATGAKTKFSHIAALLQKREEPTEFDRGIREFSLLVMKITFVLVIFIFFVNSMLKHSVLESFLFAASLAVGLTPELLPLIITANLTKGSLAIAKRGVIVKKLSAIQNFGSMDVLCSDKTGTLTEDKIELVKYVDGVGKESEKVLQAAYVNSFYQSGFKNPLDAAIQEFKNINVGEYQKIDEIPFDYMRKRNTIVAENKGERMMMAKGGPEELFKVCSFYTDTHEPLTNEWLEKIRGTYNALSREGFRVLAVAVKTLSKDKLAYEKEDEKDLVFLGFVAFLDPPKKSVIQTLKNLERLGVEIKIVTGDNELVTEKIARDINLSVKGILMGEEIERMSDAALAAKVGGITIFARVSPEQKPRIISVLRSHGHVVGYLGDGVNDAPALKAADVGISVNNAVDVAKESADIILSQKSLKELTDGVGEGRRTFANTMKYLMMALSSNFGNMFSMSAASLFLPFLPMLPVQILLNNLLYDAAQFTIPTDNVDEDEIKKPRKLSVPFLKRCMLVFGPLSSFFDFVTFAVLAFGFHLAGHAFQTGWFLESLATQTLVIYVIRTKKIPFLESAPSLLLAVSVVIIVVAGWLLPYFEVTRELFSFSALSAVNYLAIGGIVLAYLFAVQLIKSAFYKRALLSIPFNL